VYKSHTITFPNYVVPRKQL